MHREGVCESDNIHVRAVVAKVSSTTNHEMKIYNLDCATFRNKYRPGEALSVRSPGTASKDKSVIRGFRFRCIGADPVDKDI